MALEAGGVNAIMIETMTDLDEARIAVKAAKENTSCEVFCTMTFEKIIGGEFRTMMGISPSEMADVLAGAGADLIGTNCGNGMGVCMQGKTICDHGEIRCSGGSCASSWSG